MVYGNSWNGACMSDRPSDTEMNNAQQLLDWYESAGAAIASEAENDALLL